jgi:hypothetical protein
MNRFRKLGFINYDVGDNLQVHSSLLNVVLHDEDGPNLGPRAQDITESNRERSEPPHGRGTTPDNERAKRPVLPPLERLK